MKTNFFKLGLFVLAAVLLGVAAVVVLGAGALFRDEILVETYFEESVQGLDVGSPLKFRGVQIGNVKEITLAARVYETGYRYVLVRSAIFSNAMQLKGRPVELQEEIEEGLRVRLSIQGLTGAAYLEADYMNSARYDPLEIDWDPKNIRIPSAPSTITRLGEALDSIMRSLQEINLQGIAANLEESMSALSKTLDALDPEDTVKLTENLLTELRETNQVLKEFVSQDLSQTTKQAGDAFQRLDFLVTRQQQDIEAAIDNFRSASEDLKELMENAKRYPSQFIFGEPPARSQPRR